MRERATVFPNDSKLPFTPAVFFTGDTNKNDRHEGLSILLQSSFRVNDKSELHVFLAKDKACIPFLRRSERHGTAFYGPL